MFAAFLAKFDVNYRRLLFTWLLDCGVVVVQLPRN
jgi:hypothetical protein